MNKEIIEIMKQKKEVLFDISTFGSLRKNNAYMQKLLSLLDKKAFKIHTLDDMNGADSTKMVYISDNPARVDAALLAGSAALLLSNSVTNETKDVVRVPDIRSLYTIFNWILNSNLEETHTEDRPLRKVTAVIPAAGKGTRLGFDKPKALYPFLGKTALEIQYEKVRPFSERIIIIASADAEQEISEFIKSKGLLAEVVVDPEPYGSAGSVACALDKLSNARDVVVMWVDQIGIPQKALQQTISVHQRSHAALSMPTRPRKNPYIHLERDENGTILKVLRKRFNDSMPAIGENEAGIFVFNAQVLTTTLNAMKQEYWEQRNAAGSTEHGEFDFLDIIPRLAKDGHAIMTAPLILEEGKLGFNTMEEVRYHEERIAKELNMKKAVFLDRDGVINEDVGYAITIKDIKIVPEVPGALKLLKEAGLKLFVITNQAVISRGLASENDIGALHEQMNNELARLNGARIDAFYLCPHHPHANVEKYRTICDCRKPASGLILRAAAENHINLAESWMIGDRITDIAAGKGAGCTTILIQRPWSYEKNVSGTDFDASTIPDYEVQGIREAVGIIFGSQ